MKVLKARRHLKELPIRSTTRKAVKPSPEVANSWPMTVIAKRKSRRHETESEVEFSGDEPYGYADLDATYGCYLV